MPESIQSLLNQLQPDPWRTNVGFSDDIKMAHSILFDKNASKESLQRRLNEWIEGHQPCLFGRIGAKNGFISYCILTEAELSDSDTSIREKIQEARTEWTACGYEGSKSGFVILAISEKLAHAVPNDIVKQFALRLCSLYLLEDVSPDQIFHDKIFFEKPGRQATTWEWKAGINYFSAQGDKRWWQDHRIPGGMAFSINSVGHMVKSGIVARAMHSLDSILEAPEEGWIPSKVESLGQALVFAMKTISMASDGPSGKATELLKRPQGLGDEPNSNCPVELPRSLADKDYHQYLGRYHTDYSVPSEYFRPDITRPTDLIESILDFTYLFDRSIENPDFITMGEGRRIRIDEESARDSGLSGSNRLFKMLEQETVIAENPRLVEAIRRRQECSVTSTSSRGP